jgi:hypothetical protein
LFFFIHRRNSSANFNSDFPFDQEDILPTRTQSIVISVIRKQCRLACQSVCLIIATVTTGDDLIQPEPSSMPPFCHRTTLSTTGSPFVDQSEVTIQATTVVLLLNCMYLPASNMIMVIVRIWTSCVCKSEEVF